MAMMIKQFWFQTYKAMYVVFDITSDRGVSIVAGKYDEPGFDDGPLELAFLNSPVGICCRGS